ncbi:hypothetical protein LOTGIDRAFT_151867 [Lottia gigantea]|uniref:Uncharacterized protein n=1 Tax=Lottia gigantea TaxID=225164 RepID=V4BGQ4_LOTGI|nr:hypothetical protein LOTGIDRAFT_151867 [Lottia gigantea]ESP05062.1 hypothetical protein LOTGIDRAFT_151867 [Lottia gigantea]
MASLQYNYVWFLHGNNTRIYKILFKGSGVGFAEGTEKTESRMISTTPLYVTVSICLFYLTTTVYCRTDFRFLMKRDTRNNINTDSLQETLKNLDDEYQRLQKRTCAFGINSHQCTLTSLNNKMMSQAWLSDGMSPGKRSDLPNLTPDGRTQRLLDEMSNTKALLTVRDILTQADSPTARKRSCSLRLGGMCLTENLNAAANQYEYLSSGLSPGRKRRSLRHILLNRKH